MKMTNADLLALNATFAEFGEKKLPQKISYAIYKNQRILSSEVEFYQSSLDKIMESYRESFIFNEDGQVEMYPNGLPKVVKEKENDFFAEVSELLNFSFDVDLYTIDEEIFNYDEERYETIPVSLMSILIKE